MRDGKGVNEAVWKYLDTGRALANEGKLTEEIALYQQAVAELPDRSELYRELGVLQEKVGDQAGEIASYQRAIELDPRQPIWVYTTLGYLLKRQARFQESAEYYQAALQRYPDQTSFELYRQLGEVWTALQAFEWAIQAYQQALALEPDRHWIQFRIGAIRFAWGQRCLETGDLEAALIQFQQVDQVQGLDPALIHWFMAADQRWPAVTPQWLEKLVQCQPEGQDWPRITVVTPSLNQGAFIEQTIQSVLYQNYPNLEYFVVDGGSTDQTLAVLEQYATQITEVTVEPDSGQSDAINKGFSKATGDLLLWLNSDDLLAPGALHMAALTYLQQSCDVIAGMCLVHERDQITGVRLPRVRQQDFTVAALADVPHLWASGHFFFQPEVFFSRQLWQAVGAKVDESLHYAMDHDLWMRFAQANARLEVVAYPFAMFRKHAAQKTADRLASLRELISVTERYHPIRMPQTRQGEIEQRVWRFLKLPQPRLLVVGGKAAQWFHRDYRDLSWRVGCQLWQVQICEDASTMDLDQFDAVLLLVNGDGAALLKQFNVAQYTGLRLAWYWHNRKGYLSSVEIAEQVDLCIPTQISSKTVLKNAKSIVLEPILPGVVAWTAEAAAELWRQGESVKPIDRLFVDSSQQSESIKRDDEFEKILVNLRDDEICCVLSNFDHSEAQPEARSVQRFESKLAYCGFAKHAKDPSDLAAGIFAALLWGQIPIVLEDGAGGDSAWNEVFSPDLQAKLPVVRCVRDPVGTKATVKAALQRFDAAGLAERLQRYHYGLAQLWTARLEQLGEQLRAWMGQQEAAKGVEGMVAEVKRPVWDYLDAGKGLVEAAKWTEAIALYQEAIGQHPERAELHRALGVAQEKVGNVVGEIVSYQRAIELEPQPVWVYSTLGHLLIEQQQWIKAIEVYQQGLRQYPEQASFYRNSGLAQEHLGEVAAEIISYRRAIELERQPVWVYETLLELLVRQGDGVGAIAVGQLGLAQYPEQVALQQRVAELQREGQASQNGSAVSDERPEPKALVSLEAYVERAKQLTEQERFQEAIGVYQEAIGQYPEEVALYQNLKILQEKINDVVGETIQEELTQQSRQSNVYTHEKKTDQKQQVENCIVMVQSLVNQGDFEQAISIASQYLDDLPDDANLLRTLGGIFDENEQTDQAIKMYFEAIKIDAKQPVWVYISLLNRLRDEKRFDEIYSVGQTGTKQFPDDASLLRTFAAALEATGRTCDAIEAYSEAVLLEPEQPAWVYVNLIHCLRSMDNWEQAISVGKAALKNIPDNYEVMRTVAAVFAQAGYRNAAFELYSNAIRLEPNQPKWVYCALSEISHSKEDNEGSEQFQEIVQILSGETPKNKKLLFNNFAKTVPPMEQQADCESINFTARLYLAAKNLVCSIEDLHQSEEYKSFLNSKGLSTPKITSLFDYDFYLEQLPDLYRENINPVFHYCTEGYRAGLKTHIAFEPDFLQTQADVDFSDFPALLFYLENEEKESLSPHPLFDPKIYVSQVGNEFLGDKTAFEVFLECWQKRKANFSDFFDWKFYEHQVPIVKNLSLNPLIHYLLQPLEKRHDANPMFHNLYYIYAHQEAKDSGLDPLVHFILEGAAQGYSPNPFAHEEVSLSSNLPTNFISQVIKEYVKID